MMIFSIRICLPVVDDGKMSDGNITIYKIIAVYKSTVILPCDSKPDTKPVWLRNELVLDLKVCTL